MPLTFISTLDDMDLSSDDESAFPPPSSIKNSVFDEYDPSTFGDDTQPIQLQPQHQHQPKTKSAAVKTAVAPTIPSYFSNDTKVQDKPTQHEIIMASPLLKPKPTPTAKAEAQHLSPQPTNQPTIKTMPVTSSAAAELQRQLSHCNSNRAASTAKTSSTSMDDIMTKSMDDIITKIIDDAMTLPPKAASSAKSSPPPSPTSSKNSTTSATTPKTSQTHLKQQPEHNNNRDTTATATATATTTVSIVTPSLYDNDKNLTFDDDDPHHVTIFPSPTTTATNSRIFGYIDSDEDDRTPTQPCITQTTPSIKTLHAPIIHITNNFPVKNHHLSPPTNHNNTFDSNDPSSFNNDNDGTSSFNDDDENEVFDDDNPSSFYDDNNNTSSFNDDDENEVFDDDDPSFDNSTFEDDDSPSLF